MVLGLLINIRKVGRRKIVKRVVNYRKSEFLQDSLFLLLFGLNWGEEVKLAGGGVGAMRVVISLPKWKFAQAINKDCKRFFHHQGRSIHPVSLTKSRHRFAKSMSQEEIWFHSNNIDELLTTSWVNRLHARFYYNNNN